MRIGLMAHIPDQAILRRIEDVMQCDGQLDDAEARTQMAAGDRNRVDHFLPKFVGKLAQLRFRQAAQVGRQMHGIEQGRITVFLQDARSFNCGGSRRTPPNHEKLPPFPQEIKMLG